MSQMWANAVGVLKASTRQELEARLNPRGRAIVDGWCANRRRARELEAAGELLPRALEAQEQAEQALEKAQADGVKHLANHEIYELYGGPELRLA